MPNIEQLKRKPLPERTKLETISDGTWIMLPDLPSPHEDVIDLSIGDDGMLWALDSAGHVFWFRSGQWQQILEITNVSSISGGDTQHFYATQRNGQTSHWYYAGGEWQNVPLTGSIRTISGSPDGTVWALNDLNSLVRYVSESKYYEIHGQLDNLSVGSEKEVWGTLNQEVFHLVDNVLEMLDGTLVQVSVGSDGKVWGIDSLGGVYERTLGIVSWYDEWEVQEDAPPLCDITVGSRFLVAGIGKDKKIYVFQPSGLTPVLQIQNLDELLMCGRFANWAYLLSPWEANWWTPQDQMLSSIFANSPWTINRVYDNLITSSEAYLASTKLNKTIILAIRGSQEMTDWVMDFTTYAVPYTPLGKNFTVSLWVYTAWMSIASAVKTDLTNVITELGGPAAISNIYVVGHSLGAAIATFAAYDLCTSVLSQFPVSKIKMVNFASPPVGDRKFVSAYTQLGFTSFRVIDPNDQILIGANVLKNYWLFGTWADVGQLVPVPSGSGHSMVGYIDTLNTIYANTKRQSAASLKQYLRTLEISHGISEE
jgi:hypothetical protein